MNIKTERLILLPVDYSHKEEIFKSFTQEITKYLISEPHFNISYTHEVITMFKRQEKEKTDYVFTVFDKENMDFLGLVGLHDIKKEPSLGIWLKKSAHGNKYGVECLSKIIEYAKSIGIKKLLYKVHLENIASRKIALYFQGILISNYEVERSDSGRIIEYEIYEINLA